MAKLNIVKEGDPVLRGKCRPVTEITPRIITLLDDMIETLHDANGAGLAAPQVGVLRRIVIVDVGEGPIIMINPEITYREGEQETLEGCLSVPGEWGITRRPMKVRAQYTDRNGDDWEIEGEGLLAKAICHELDHLDGILYIDNVVRMVDPSELETDDDDEE